MTTISRLFDDVSVGDVFEDFHRTPTHVQLFRYSAATGNPHRIHYDQAYAASEGYPDVLVQSHLHGAFVAQACAEFAGPNGRVSELDVSIRRFAVPGDALTCAIEVVGKEEFDEAFGLVRVEVRETRRSDGEVCVPATASILLPLNEGARHA
ncbi:MaoC family dehydratase [Nocardia sp. NPDC004711]